MVCHFHGRAASIYAKMDPRASNHKNAAAILQPCPAQGQPQNGQLAKAPPDIDRHAGKPHADCVAPRQETEKTTC